MRDLVVNTFGRQPLHHDCGYIVLEHETINSAHHYDSVQSDQQCGHGPSQSKSGVEYDQWDGEQRQPNMCAQPTLHRADAPKHDFFPQSKQSGKNENTKRDRAENESKRGRAHVDIARRIPAQPREPHFHRQSLWMKGGHIKETGSHCPETEKEEPDDVDAIEDAHLGLVVNPT